MRYWKFGAVLALALMVVLLWQFQTQTGNDSSDSASVGASSRSSGPGGRGARSALVVTAEVGDALINDRLKAVGDGLAQSSVSVVPLSAGLLTRIQVTPGQHVEKGDVLALLDDEEERIARDRAASAASNAAVEEARLAELFRTQTTTEAELIRLRATLDDANLALREAELALARRRITAPISGHVGLIPVDAGNYVTTQSEILTIDDRETIVVQFWVPERFASQIRVGQPIEATPQADPSRKHVGTITAIGSRVESDSRTLPVEAELDNAQDTLRPGMSFNLTLTFDGERYPAINPLAIQWDSNGSYVWKLVGEKVERVPVRIIQRNPESVLVASELITGDEVVIEGLMTLRPGAGVRVQGGGRADERPSGAEDRRPGTDGTTAAAGTPRP